MDGLLNIYRQAPLEDSIALVAKIKKALDTFDIEGLVQQLNATIADIPYDYWNADTESIFTVITSLIFKKAGIDIYTEVHSAKGRCDVLVKTDKYIYVLELKLDGTATEALDQIKQKGYLQPYAADSRKKIAVGISFSSEKRAVLEHVAEVI